VRGDTLWVIAGEASAKTWWRNLAGGAPVEVLLRRRVRAGRAVAATPVADPELVEEGLRRYAERFPGTAKRLGIDGAEPAALRRVAARTVVVRVELRARRGRWRTPGEARSRPPAHAARQRSAISVSSRARSRRASRRPSGRTMVNGSARSTR
jgi:hypothetical protein